MKYIALDLETFLIKPDITCPKPVCLAWYMSDDTESGVVGNNIVRGESACELEKKAIELFDRTLAGEFKQVWHNGFEFDLPVLWTHFPSLRERIEECLDRELIHDTLIREKLFNLSTRGGANPYYDEKEQKLKYAPAGFYSLNGLAKRYLGEDLSKWKEGDDIWRLRYSTLDWLDVRQYPKEAYEYALLDVSILAKVMAAQLRVQTPLGPGSMNTESLQIKAGFVLALATRDGLRVDLERLAKFEAELETKITPIQKILLDGGYAKYDKKNKLCKQKKKVVEYLTTTYPDCVTYTSPSKTYPEGQVQITNEALEEYPAQDPIVSAMSKISILEKFQTTYIKNIREGMGVFRGVVARGCVRGYSILKNSGRVGGFIQTMPRDGGIRELFIPMHEDEVFIQCDYNGIEIVTSGQADIDLGLGDSLAQYLNSGTTPRDPHALLASEWHALRVGQRLTPDEFQKLRESGDAEAQRSRKEAKGPNLSYNGGAGNKRLGEMYGLPEETVKQIREVYYRVVPEAEKYLGNKGWVGQQKYHADRRRTFAYGYNGRWRSFCTYAACANGRKMQTPAADGAKEALWRAFKALQRIGAKLSIFIHDEMVATAPRSRALEAAKILAQTMCEGMRVEIPDIRIAVEWSVLSRWTKDDPQYILAKGRAWINPDGQFFYEEHDVNKEALVA